MTDTTKDYIEEAFNLAFQRTIRTAGMRHMLSLIQNTITPEYGSLEKEVTTAITTIYMKLYKVECDAWRNFLTWAIAQKDENARKRVKEMIYERSLDEGMSIMHHLSHDGKCPGSYYTAVEKEFREQIKIALDIL